MTTTAEHANVAVVGGGIAPTAGSVLAWTVGPGPQPADELVDDAVREHIRRITSGDDQGRPSPGARARMAAALYEVTRWPIFKEEHDERTYVSRLWAEDWDCDEDAVYDDPA